MGRGPNSSGGRRNAAAAYNGPARARFSSWQSKRGRGVGKGRGSRGDKSGNENGKKKKSQSREEKKSLEKQYLYSRRLKEGVHLTKEETVSMSLPCVAKLDLDDFAYEVVTDLLALLQTNEVSTEKAIHISSSTRVDETPNTDVLAPKGGKPITECNLGLLEYLTKILNFKESDASTAIFSNMNKETGECTLSDALDWLCLTLSESSVSQSLNQFPSNIKLYKRDHKSLQLEALAYKINCLGFDMEKCKSMLRSLELEYDDIRQLEDQTIWKLLSSYRDEADVDGACYIDSEGLDANVLDDERIVLESVYGTESISWCRKNRMLLSLRNEYAEYSLEVSFPDKGYPHTAPLILLKMDKLSKNKKQHIMKEIARECTKRRGQPMLYDIICWINEKLSGEAQAKKENSGYLRKQTQSVNGQSKSKNRHKNAVDLYAEQYWAKQRANIERSQLLIARQNEKLMAEAEYQNQRDLENKRILKDERLQKAIKSVSGNCSQAVKNIVRNESLSPKPVQVGVQVKNAVDIQGGGGSSKPKSLCDVMKQKRKSGGQRCKTESAKNVLAETNNKSPQSFDEDAVRLNKVKCLPLEQDDEISDLLKKKSERMREQYEVTKKKKIQQYIKITKQRNNLPAYQMSDKIVKTIECNRVVVISGATGCGKTTQVPQLIYDHYLRQNKVAALNLVCTQPRRISAIGVSERVAAERLEKIGHTVGYSIRLESRKSKNTKLLFCTTGYLLRTLQSNPNLDGISHLFIDEVHERSKDTDFLLVIVRRLMRNTNRKLRLVLMSATLNSTLFSQYFADAPVLEIPGRTFPVKDFYLEDVIQKSKYVIGTGSEYMYYPPKVSSPVFGSHSEESGSPENENSIETLKRWYPGCSLSSLETLKQLDQDKINYELIEALLRYVCSSDERSCEEYKRSEYLKESIGSVLIFLPGLAEISTLYNLLLNDTQMFGNRTKYLLLPLHSSLSTAEQKRCFENPKAGVRKIIIATNIAETSITIDDVTVVIDSGKVKENRYDENKKMCTLMETWISSASSKQRSGRAGRVKSGTCYHLYTSRRKLDEFTMPEILRQPLDDIILQIKVLKLGQVESFLREAVSPPSTTAIRNAIRMLKGIRAVEVETESFQSGPNDFVEDLDLRKNEVTEVLTPLGFHLASLPVDPRIGKMMILGSVFRCLDPILTIAAGMSCSRSPFIAPFEKRELADKAKRDMCGHLRSDHLAIMEAYNQWKAVQILGYKRNTLKKDENNFLSKNFLSRQALETMKDLRGQLRDQLVDIGFASPKRYSKGQRVHKFDENENSENIDLIKMIVGAALYPNIIVANYKLDADVEDLLRRKNGNSSIKFRTFEGPVNIHPTCLAYSCTNVHELGSKLLVFFEQLKTTKVFIRDATVISPYSVLLFGGDLVVNHVKNNIVLDGWLKFSAPAKVGVLIKLIRQELSRILWEKIEQPTFHSEVSERVITSIGILVQTITGTST